MADFYTPLATLGQYQNSALNPYAGMRMDQYLQGADNIASNIQKQQTYGQKQQFGNWLKDQINAGQNPSRMQVASQVAPFDPNSALDIMWERQYQGRSGSGMGAAITANAALKEANAQKALDIAKKMDIIGQQILAKKNNAQDYSQDLMAMESLNAEYIRYTGKPYESAVTKVLENMGVEFSQKNKTAEQEIAKTKVAEDTYRDMRKYVTDSLDPVTKDGKTIADKLNKMMEAFRLAAKGNSSAAMVAMKSLVQSIDNSVVMPSEMGQIGSQDLLNKGKQMLEQYLGLGRNFTAQDLTDAWYTATSFINELNNSYDKIAAMETKKAQAQIARTNVLTEADIKALYTIISETFNELKPDAPGEVPAFADIVDKLIGTDTKPDSVKEGDWIKRDGAKFKVRKDDKGLYIIYNDAIKYLN